jgi:hypothetical protein
LPLEHHPQNKNGKTSAENPESPKPTPGRNPLSSAEALLGSIRLINLRV